MSMFTGTDAPSSNIPTFTRIPPDLLGVEGECLHDKTDVCHNALLHNITNTVIARLCFGQTAQVLMSEMTSLRISLLCPLERPFLRPSFTAEISWCKRGSFQKKAHIHRIIILIYEGVDVATDQ